MSRIEHFALFADDLERLVAFYREVFGLSVLVDNSDAIPPGYFLGDGAGCVLELIARPSQAGAVDQRFVCHVAFHVEDPETVRDELERRSLVVESDTRVQTPEVTMFFFRDPAENRVQVVRRTRRLEA
jgi:glyoxylase I family protein